MPQQHIVDQIRAKLRQVEALPSMMMVLSKSEHMEVALVKNDLKILERAHFTILEAAVRLGPAWLEAALYVQRNGWAEESAEA